MATTLIGWDADNTPPGYEADLRVAVCTGHTHGKGHYMLAFTQVMYFAELEDATAYAAGIRDKETQRTGHRAMTWTQTSPDDLDDLDLS